MQSLQVNKAIRDFFKNEFVTLLIKIKIKEKKFNRNNCNHIETLYRYHYTKGQLCI